MALPTRRDASKARRLACPHARTREHAHQLSLSAHGAGLRGCFARGAPKRTVAREALHGGAKREVGAVGAAAEERELRVGQVLHRIGVHRERTRVPARPCSAVLLRRERGEAVVRLWRWHCFFLLLYFEETAKASAGAH